MLAMAWWLLLIFLAGTGTAVQADSYIPTRPGEVVTRRITVMEDGVPLLLHEDTVFKPLHWAAYHGKLSVVRQLIEEHNFSVNSTNSDKDTALHNAAAQDHYLLINYLLDAGAYLEARGRYDYTPLHSAANKGRDNATSLLLERGARINALDNSNETALHLAARQAYPYISRRRFVETVRVLLGAGATCDLQNEMGETPLHLAASKGTEDMVRDLMAANCSLTITDEEGRTPEMRTNYNGLYNIREELFGPRRN